MRIFKHISFDRWALSENLTDTVLLKAVKEMESGLYEANLGSGLYKKRIAMPGRGKSGGYRVLIACQWHETAFFYMVFLKMNETISLIMKKKFIEILRKIY